VLNDLPSVFFALVKEAPSAKEKTLSKEASLLSVKKHFLNQKIFNYKVV